jgi:hypothetical protein
MPDPTPDIGFGDELDDILEAGQLTAHRQHALPPADLGPRTFAALWVLRITALMLVAMVTYTFITQLHSPTG